MSTVAILGAGPLGGATAHALARTPGVRAIRLIDPRRDVAAGKALDIQQAGPVEGFDTTVTAPSGPGGGLGATLIVVADDVAPTEDDSAWARLTELTRINEHAVVVAAAAGHRSLVRDAIDRGGLTARRVVGSAPTALAAALRAILSLELQCSPRDVDVLPVGVPPDGLVLPWDAATAQGVRLSSRLDPRSLARLEQKVASLWPPGPYALAAACATVCRSILTGRTGRVFPCFVKLQDELGVRGVVGAVPITLDASGVRQIVEPSLSEHERTRIETALRAG